MESKFYCEKCNYRTDIASCYKQHLETTLHKTGKRKERCDKTLYKCNFDIETHRDIIDNLKVIEENILKKLNVKEKIPQYKIYEQIKNGNIKIFNDIGNKSSSSFILKISGIWETLSNFGLTYKFVKVD
jgi:hypothetical protein